jgi:hypothetical protein
MISPWDICLRVGPPKWKFQPDLDWDRPRGRSEHVSTDKICSEKLLLGFSVWEPTFYDHYNFLAINKRFRDMSCTVSWPSTFPSSPLLGYLWQLPNMHMHLAWLYRFVIYNKTNTIPNIEWDKTTLNVFYLNETMIRKHSTFKIAFVLLLLKQSVGKVFVICHHAF